MSPREARRSDTFIHYGIAAAAEAIEDAGLDDSGINPERIGLAVGAGIGGIASIERTHMEYLEKVPRRISPFFVPSVIINIIDGYLSIKYSNKKLNLSMVTSGTT